MSNENKRTEEVGVGGLADKRKAAGHNFVTARSAAENRGERIMVTLLNVILAGSCRPHPRMFAQEYFDSSTMFAAFLPGGSK